jgi:hypothetical protein
MLEKLKYYLIRITNLKDDLQNKLDRMDITDSNGGLNPFRK